MRVDHHKKHQIDYCDQLWQILDSWSCSYKYECQKFQRVRVEYILVIHDAWVCIIKSQGGPQPKASDIHWVVDNQDHDNTQYQFELALIVSIKICGNGSCVAHGLVDKPCMVYLSINIASLNYVLAEDHWEDRQHRTFNSYSYYHGICVWDDHESEQKVKCL